MRACLCFAMVFFLLGICRTTEADYTRFEKPETFSGWAQKRGAMTAEMRIERRSTRDRRPELQKNKTGLSRMNSTKVTGQAMLSVPTVLIKGFDGIGNKEAYYVLIEDSRGNPVYKKANRSVKIGNIDSKEIFLVTPLGRIPAQKRGESFEIDLNLSNVRINLKSTLGKPISGRLVDIVAYCSDSDGSVPLNVKTKRTDKSGALSFLIPGICGSQKNIRLRIFCSGFEHKEIQWNGKREVAASLAPAYMRCYVKPEPGDEFAKGVLEHANIWFEILDEKGRVLDIAKVDDKGLLSFRINNTQKHGKYALGFSFGHPINAEWDTGYSVDLEKYATDDFVGRDAGFWSEPKSMKIELDMEELEGKIGNFLPHDIHVALGDNEVDDKLTDHGGGGGGGGGGS